MLENLNPVLEIPSTPETRAETSTLSPELQAYVRTPEFKAWFGDWEGNPAEASKIVDENGEPRLVFSGRPHGIAQLDGGHRARTGGQGTANGYYFTKQYGSARAYATQVTDPETGAPAPGSIYSSFLNVRHPDYVTEKGRIITGQLTELSADVDGYINDRMGEIVVFDPSQIATVHEQPVDEYGRPMASENH